jgi:glycosyltransferase involved in cell wall biosynthesis
MKKPVIVGDNTANKELFENRKNALLVKMADADALADAILELKENEKLREESAENGYETFKLNCQPKIIGKDIKKIIEKLVGR